ncbi:RHS repeat-associated core domain-containing protein [Empedobacter falsenii]|uniref:RHS repeat domain-containing protein n=1 Tax=Empedobacter falsenii TaxID=343874 RepID=UPI003A806DDA
MKYDNETRGTSGGLANNGITNGLYTNVAYPTSFTKITTINYYDEYTNLGVTPSSIDGQSVIGVTDTKTKGLAVASFTNVLGTTTWAKNYTYYDAKYIRPVATASTNYLGGYTNTASSLDFRGKPLKTITKHKQLAASTELTLTDEFVYYPNELLKSQTHQINSGAKEYIVQNSYNEINQLTIKKVGNSVATTPLQTIDYKYNIRGWMTDINNVDVTETTTYKDLFAFSIYYDNPHPGYGFRPGKYNGNISQTRWKSSTDNIIRNYVYEYDNLNRLTGSFYVKGDYLVGDVYNEYANYDKNGNILNMYRSGNQDLSSNMIWIDDLTYSYKLNSNKLLAVTDASTLKDGFNDGNKTGDDYTYDTNGNLTVDKNKGITKISYNFLNLPTEVLWNASKKINYTYDASGVKLRKVVTDGTTVTTTDYLGGFQYQNNVLQFFPTTEGYVNVTNGTAFNYVYNYTDHLGNVRLSYQKEANGSLKVLEENNYYPFGLKHSGYNNTNLANANYKYKYNGKELQDELSLNLYDYGARNYDPAIGRWFNIDPLAVRYVDNSPYNYTLNNPVYFIDPDGMQVDGPGDEDEPIELQEAVVTAITPTTKAKREISNFFNIPFKDISTIENSALKSYANLFNDPNATKWYLEMHNGKLSKSIDNAILGTTITIIMLPVALEYGTIVLIKYGADVIMQAAISKTFTGEYKVNFINAAIGSVSPGFISPITTEMSDVSQNLLNNELKFSDLISTEFLMTESLKIGTGYIGNGLGKLGEGKSVLGDKASPLINEGLQSFHNNLQSQMITENSKK